MARIVIHHLASIHHMEMDIRQMNIFIGEQATGKSTLCKAVYFFRNLKSTLINYFYMLGQQGKDEKGLVREINSRLKSSFVSLFGYSWRLPEDLSLEFYYTQEYWIKIYLVIEKKKYLSVNYSEELLEELRKLHDYAQQYYYSIADINSGEILSLLEREKYYKYLEQEISTLLEDNMSTYYMPAGRGLLSLLCNQLTYLNYDEIDPINRRFMQTIESIQPRFEDGITKVHKFFPIDERKFDVGQMSREIIKGMKGEYYYQKGREFLQVESSEERIPINFISSGQQEILWLYNQLYVLMLRDEKAFVIIEEPEAHLYPILQKNILDFIVKYINITGGSALVTTHSPYILTEANNLYITGRLRDRDINRREIERTVGKWSFISPGALNAYKLSASIDGTEFHTLINADTDELMAEEIDEISSEINEVYTKLFYLEEETYNEQNG